MTRPEMSGIAPFFVVKSVPAALSFYRDRLGFEVTFEGPSRDDVFFGIVQRDAAMIMLKDVGVDPLPNGERDGGRGWARWDTCCSSVAHDRRPREWPWRDRRRMEASWPEY